MLSIILHYVTVFTRMFETARRFVLWALKKGSDNLLTSVLFLSIN